VVNPLLRAVKWDSSNLSGPGKQDQDNFSDAKRSGAAGNNLSLNWGTETRKRSLGRFTVLGNGLYFLSLSLLLRSPSGYERQIQLDSLALE
jgi:hypothetical protein